MEAQPTDLSLPELQARGYFRTSRKYRHAVRIDRADWLRVMLRSMHPSTTVVDLLARYSLDSLAQQYRVSYSRDVVELPAERMAEFLQLENSQHAGYRYVPVDGDPVPEPWGDRDVAAVRTMLATLWPGMVL